MHIDDLIVGQLVEVTSVNPNFALTSQLGSRYRVNARSAAHCSFEHVGGPVPAYISPIATVRWSVPAIERVFLPHLTVIAPFADGARLRVVTNHQFGNTTPYEVGQTVIFRFFDHPDDQLRWLITHQGSPHYFSNAYLPELARILAPLPESNGTLMPAMPTAFTFTDGLKVRVIRDACIKAADLIEGEVYRCQCRNDVHGRDYVCQIDIVEPNSSRPNRQNSYHFGPDNLDELRRGLVPLDGVIVPPGPFPAAGPTPVPGIPTVRRFFRPRRGAPVRLVPILQSDADNDETFHLGL